MNLLVIGGSGHVGSLILPYLAEHYTLRVFDLKPPIPTLPSGREGAGGWVQGDVRDYAALEAAAQGCDKLLYMAMGNAHGWNGTENATAQFDVNVTGLHLALRAAHAAGIRHAALTSSMSVYEQLGNRHFWDEDAEPDAHHHYGLTKRLGEEVARAAWRQWGISVNALRLCLPVSAESWQALAAAGKQDIHTEASDVARAILAALEHDFGGFQAFMISGDYAEKRMEHKKAKAMLGWEPRMRLEPTGVGLPEGFIEATYARIAASPELTAFAQRLRAWFAGTGERGEVPEGWDEACTLCLVLEGSERERAEHARRGIPTEVTFETQRDVGIWLRHCQRTLGVTGIAAQHFGWFKLHASGKLCRLGRLQFAIEAYGWDDVPGLEKGDTVLGMHIPAEAPLDIDACRESLRVAFPFFDKHFPELPPAKAIVCSSWMLGDWVPEAAGVGGSLDRFQQLFHLLPGSDSPTSACYFVFGYREVDPATAPRDTRLRRNLLALLEAGKPVNAGRCYLLREEVL